MHPPAVQKLESLGLLSALRRAGGMPVYGFVVMRGPKDSGTMLSYSEIPEGGPVGFAIDHGLLTRTLLDEVSKRPGVEVREGVRVLDSSADAEGVEVEIESAGETEQGAKERSTLSAHMMVSAEGRGSKLRTQAGLPVERGAPAYMIGWCVENGRLPFPGYGHIFTGGPTIALAYQIAPDQVRVMFQLPAGVKELPEACVDTLPSPFREDLRAAMAKEPGQQAKIFSLCPGRVSTEGMAIVGDAGGCAHPISASGISFCLDDAMRLADCLDDARVNGGREWIARGLEVYDASRRQAMRTRMALATALSASLHRMGAEATAIQDALFNYWQHSRRGRGASMALLSTSETRLRAVTREYASVILHSVIHGDAEGSRTRSLPALLRVAGRSAMQAMTGERVRLEQPR